MRLALLPFALLLSAVRSAPVFDHRDYDLLLGLELDPAAPLSSASQKTFSFSNEVLESVAAIVEDVIALKATLDTFEPDAFLSLSTASTVQTQTMQISRNIHAAALAADASSLWSSTESYDVAVAVVALEPILQSLLTNIVTHKPAFAAEMSIYGLGQSIRLTLEQQSDLVRKFGDVLVERLAAPFSSFVPLLVTQMLEHYKDAALVYDGCRGLVCVPPRLSVTETKELAFERWQLERVDEDGNVSL